MLLRDACTAEARSQEGDGMSCTRGVCFVVLRSKSFKSMWYGLGARRQAVVARMTRAPSGAGVSVSAAAVVPWRLRDFSTLLFLVRGGLGHSHGCSDGEAPRRCTMGAWSTGVVYACTLLSRPQRLYPSSMTWPPVMYFCTSCRACVDRGLIRYRDAR